MIRHSRPPGAAAFGVSGALAAVAILLAGCNTDTRDRGAIGQVSGKVTYKDQPVTGGIVNFYSAETLGGGVAKLNADGSFDFSESAVGGVPVGTYKVFITPATVQEAGDPGAAPPAEQPADDSLNIPEKYKQQGTTDLTAEVKEGDNPLTFDLKD